MKYSKSILLLVLTFFFTSCYHAQITTDKNPSSQVIDKPWASSFIFGLVPPPVVETASECPNGLARVETKISFLNGLVSAITFQLYTPMHITVTCAAAGAGSALIDSDREDRITIFKKMSEEQKVEAFTKASEKSLDMGKPVYIAFD